ncbi:MAG: ABC transporter ATP-binding protein [Candidatus Eisenbacteria bacterium]|nr:ABC transporter ATP-binding protein [Candidatus Eisenbacteria bacterium]
MSSAPVRLSIHGLQRRFGAHVAVADVSLEVRAGEIVGFLGANGAGKTTTLRCASGLLRPHAGRIEVDGHDLWRAPREAKAALGFVPDRPYLYERLSPPEFLGFIAALYGVPPALAEARIHALLGRLALGDAADALIEGASLGTRQKIAVAAALLHEPPALLLDEPLAGLDPPSAFVLKQLLRERTAAGAGVLVSTHQLEVAERFCDRVVMLRRGRVVASGTLAELRGARGDATLETLFLELAAERTEP